MTDRIGIDLGGTKIEGVVMSPGREILRRERVATPNAYPDIVRAVVELVTALRQTAPDATVGIGAPGASNAAGLLYNSNTVCLNGRPLRADIEAALGRPVRMVNDANCLALSEATDGAAAGAELVFGVILGTGVGGGIVVRGRVLSGPHGIGGEWGHNPLPWATGDEAPGLQCWCGRHGCLETWVSGPGLSMDHFRVTGEKIAVERIMMQVVSGDERAAASLDRHAGRLARGLAHVVNILDPEVIVLGGGLSKLPHLYAELPERMKPHIFADDPIITVLPPRWGDASGVRGAAWLAPV